MPVTLQTAAVCPQAWDNLGLRLAPETVNDDEAYLSNESGFVWIALNDLGGQAPVNVVRALLAARGYSDTDRILLEAATDKHGGYAFYRLAER